MMKKILALSALSLLWLSACQKDNPVDFQQLDDESLAISIADDRNKEDLNPETLPTSVLSNLAENDFDTYIEKANFVRNKGYEILMANDDQAYFNLNGRRLVHRPLRLLGRCGALGGEPIRIDQLRPAITDYIATNYPDNTILRAMRRGDKVIVLLNDYQLIVFSADGVHEVDARHWFDCLSCVDGSTVDLPQHVQDMINNRLPGADIQRVCRRGDRIVIGLTNDGGRKILVFDRDWNFLFAQ
jgi:hypothetical protein